MRVTDNMRLAAAVANEARLAARLHDATRKAASGLAVESPEDDPVAFGAIVSRDAAIARMESHLGAAERARGDAELAEGALAQAAEIFAQARAIALDMASGDKGPADRAAGAAAVTQLREALHGISNTRGALGYLFAGTKTDTPPFDAAGTFEGNTGALQVEVADGVAVTVNANGARAFTAAGGRDLMADLDALAAALASDDVAGVQALLDPLERGGRQLVDARADAGLTVARLATAADVAGSTLVSLRTARARDAEADPVAAYTALASAQNAYERSLAVTRQILSLSSSAGR